MPKYAPNKMPSSVKKRYFELLRDGYKGAAAARVVGVSTSCGSKWFLEAGGVIVPDPGPISPRFLTQEDRIAITDGLQAKQPLCAERLSRITWTGAPSGRAARTDLSAARLLAAPLRRRLTPHKVSSPIE